MTDPPGRIVTEAGVKVASPTATSRERGVAARAIALPATAIVATINAPRTAQNHTSPRGARQPGTHGRVEEVTGWLFERGTLSATTQTVCWTVIFFFASAAASAAYLTVSEVFPLEIRPRYWGPGRFRQALPQAMARGRVRARGHRFELVERSSI